MDHRTLLMKYITLVGEAEGTSFISDRWRAEYFTDEEWEELKQVDAESETHYNNDTRRYEY